MPNETYDPESPFPIAGMAVPVKVAGDRKHLAHPVIAFASEASRDEALRDLRAMAAVKDHLLTIDYVRRSGATALIRVGDWRGRSILATGEDVVDVIEDALAALGEDDLDVD